MRGRDLPFSSDGAWLVALVTLVGAVPAVVFSLCWLEDGPEVALLEVVCHVVRGRQVRPCNCGTFSCLCPCLFSHLSSLLTAGPASTMESELNHHARAASLQDTRTKDPESEFQPHEQSERVQRKPRPTDTKREKVQPFFTRLGCWPSHSDRTPQ